MGKTQRRDSGVVDDGASDPRLFNQWSQYREKVAGFSQIRSDGEFNQASICNFALRGLVAESFHMRGLVTTLWNS